MLGLWMIIALYEFTGAALLAQMPNGHTMAIVLAIKALCSVIIGVAKSRGVH